MSNTASSAASDANLQISDITTNNVTSTAHGFTPKSGANAAQFLNGAATPAFAAVTDANLSVSDITTNNVTTSAHGFAPKDWMNAWISWSPSYTNITVGNGTVVAKYMQIGKSVWANWQIVAGTTSSISNNAHLTLPATANTRYGTANTFNWAGGHFYDHSGTIYTGPIGITASTSDMFIYFFSATASQITGSVPASFASGDALSIGITYEAA